VFAMRFASSISSADWVCNVEARSATGDERYEKAGSCACRGLLCIYLLADQFRVHVHRKDRRPYRWRGHGRRV
jgi:hypothetical protein